MHHAKGSGFHVMSALFPEQSKTLRVQCQTWWEREGGEREGERGREKERGWGRLKERGRREKEETRKG